MTAAAGCFDTERREPDHFFHHFLVQEQEFPFCHFSSPSPALLPPLPPPARSAPRGPLHPPGSPSHSAHPSMFIHFIWDAKSSFSDTGGGGQMGPGVNVVGGRAHRVRSGSPARSSVYIMSPSESPHTPYTRLQLMTRRTSAKLCFSMR